MSVSNSLNHFKIQLSYNSMTDSNLLFDCYLFFTSIKLKIMSIVRSEIQTLPLAIDIISDKNCEQIIQICIYINILMWLAADSNLFFHCAPICAIIITNNNRTARTQWKTWIGTTYLGHFNPNIANKRDFMQFIYLPHQRRLSRSAHIPISAKESDR